MPIYEMRAPNGRTYRIEGPAGATDEQVRAEIMRQHPDADKPAPAAKAKPAAPPRQKGTGVAPVDFALDAINETAIGAAQGAVGLGAFFTDPLVGLIYGDQAKNKMKQERANFFDEASRQVSSQPMSVYREVGKTIAPGAAVSRTAGLAAPMLEKVPVIGNALARVAKAASSGGIGSGRTTAQTAKLSRSARAGQLVERAAGGAIAGGATAGLSDQNVLEGAAFGAGLPVVASVIKNIAGFVGDITKLPRQKAAEIIRKALEDNVDEARAVFASLSPDDRRLAEQVLVDAKIEPRTFFGIGNVAQEQINPTAFAKTLENQAFDRSQRLAQVSGGGNATERRAAAEAAAEGVNEVSGPRRETALGNVRTTNKAVLDAQRIANIVRSRADELNASGTVPRMRGLEERSAEQAAVMADNPAYFPDMERIQQTRGIAGAAGQRADAGISTQVGLRDTERQMDDVVAELAAEGRNPLRAAQLSNLLRRQANAAGVKTSSARPALLKLAAKIDGAADTNGMLDPYDLYTLRKEASDIVEKYVSSGVQPSTGSKKRAAGLVMQFKSDVDTALGTEFQDYLGVHRQGMEAVNRQELASKGAQLADENAPEFIKLMQGQRDRVVEDVMGRGTGNYDIVKAFEQDPAAYLALKKSADELATLNRMNELRGQGAGAASNLMIKERPSMLTRGLTAATMSSIPSLRIGAQGAEQVERALMTPRVQREIGTAFLNGQNMNALLNTFPTQARISEQVSALPAGLRNAFAQGTTAPAYASPVPIDPETGFPAFDEEGNPLTTVIALADGTPTPVYLPRSKPANVNSMRR